MGKINGGKSSRHLGHSTFLDQSSAASYARGLGLTRINLINDGRDTELRLGDGSTIVLKGVKDAGAVFAMPPRHPSIAAADWR